MSETLVLTRPDDWHVHLRDGAALQSVVPYTARQFARAIAMPNLKPPITTAEQALAYRQRILAAVPAGVDFEPLMTLYLTDRTTPEDIAAAKAAGSSRSSSIRPAPRPTAMPASPTSARPTRRWRPCRRPVCCCWCTAK